ncbi:SMI1/KNR4 family protein [Streptomyces sp. NPDC090085]|uniref:SMI1/KNR4 family protein n=1 Tax=Streptomyces sp. NPDC090085 TaxID=3365943 RepID=UPI0038309A3D
MTSPRRGSSEPQLVKHQSEPEVDRENDDVLIDKLRARAWDPALRFDRAQVPLTWIAEHYGQAGIERIQGRIVSRSSSGEVTLDAREDEITNYFADAPREPLFAPITGQEVDAAERIIGRPLPELLRRIYTEVGNGGFGPDAGIASLTTGQRAPGHVTDWHSSVRMHERNRIEGLPSSWLYLVPGGCTMEWHVSLLALDNPVLLFDADGWEPSWGEDPHDGLRSASPSLRHWLGTWARGGDVWAQVHDHA